MLPTHTDLATQTDMLPAQNIGLVDQNQPQIFSLLPSSNSPNSKKKPRRKKSAKLDETIPVVINPQLTRTPTGVTFAEPHHRSTSLPEPISASVPTRAVNDHRLPFRLCLDHNSYDTNYSIHSNQILPLTISLNSSLPTQILQIPTRSVSVVNTNTIPQLMTKSQLFGVNQLLYNNINERTVPVTSLQQNEHNYRQSSFISTDQGSSSPSSHSPSVSSSLSSLPVSDVPSIKPKRKYCKKQRVSSFAEQQQQLAQQTCSCSTPLPQPNTLNNLPSIIPASIIAIPSRSEEQPLQIDTQSTSNFVPLTPPGSIKSVKSPPTNIITELSLMPVQQNSLPFNTTNTAEINPISKQYFPAQRSSYPRKAIIDSFNSSLPYHFNRFLTDAHAQYCIFPSSLIPTNIVPMTCSSMLPETINNNPSVSLPTDMEKERKRRKNSIRKSRIMQTPTIEIQSKEVSLTSKSLTTDISILKRGKHKISSAKDIRTKKQLRRIKRQNRLAVLKFMMRKRKQQKQQPIAIPQRPDTKVEQMTPKLVNNSIVTPEKMETNLPDIIASSLKISFDTTQKIESISLYYHRRRQPDPIDVNPSKSPMLADNRLGLLAEAVELLETMNGCLKLEPPSNR